MADLRRTYSSFSGVDIEVVVGGVIVGELQAFSFAIQREKAPIFVLGSVDPISFARGKRGIAGTLISVLLNEHLLYRAAFKEYNFVADKDEIFPDIATDSTPETADDLQAVGGAAYDVTTPITSLEDAWEVRRAWYVDQLPPFDVVVVGGNEYGVASQMRVYGIEILNEGSGFSIDDTSIESQMTYVARTLAPWQKVGTWDLSDGTFTAESSS